MVQKIKPEQNVPSQSQFAESLLSIGAQFPLGKVFDDFLTIAIAENTKDPKGNPIQRDKEYLEAIAYYKDSELRFEFPKAYGYLIAEVEARLHSESGNDVLGEFYEQHLSPGMNEQYITEYSMCKTVATIRYRYITNPPGNRSYHIIDYACGSGKLLLAYREVKGDGHLYHGIDSDHTCVKMTALNLFLNGIWGSEVMCADELVPDDFKVSYLITRLPLGIFKIVDKNISVLWRMLKYSKLPPNNKLGPTIILDPTPISERPKDNSTQLDLFGQ
jgi:type I restriction-modification system DNA methylase subunit